MLYPNIVHILFDVVNHDPRYPYAYQPYNTYTAQCTAFFYRQKDTLVTCSHCVRYATNIRQVFQGSG
jgi:hypothetical protein